MARWLEVWGERAKDAWEFEPTTTSYGGCLPVIDEGGGDAGNAVQEVVVFERYANGRQAMEDHCARVAHTEMNDKMIAERLSLRWGSPAGSQKSDMLHIPCLNQFKTIFAFGVQTVFSTSHCRYPNVEKTRFKLVLC